EFDRPSDGDSAVQIDVAFGQVCKRIEPLAQVSMLACLDKPQMPFRQKGRVAGERAEDANAKLSYCIAHQAAVTLAGDAVENYAGNADVRVMRHEPPHHGRGGLRLRGHVKHEYNRHRVPRGEVGCCAGAAAERRRPVEQTHHAFDHQQMAIACGFAQQCVKKRGRHGPSVEIERFPSRRRSVKRGVDVVGACLRRPHRDALSLERRKQAEGDGRLTGAGIWRCDDESACGHDAISATVSRSCSGSLTMLPMTMIEGVPSCWSCASAATRARLDTTTRSSMVVALTMTAAGVLGGKPPRINSSAIFARLRIAM